MQKKYIWKKALLTLTALTLAFVFLGVSRAFASTSSANTYCTPPPSAANSKNPSYHYCQDCASNNSATSNNVTNNNYGCVNNSVTNCTSTHCDLISAWINPAINIFAGMVGIVVVIGIILGSIQYAASAGDPQAAAKAKGRISNAIIALIAFAFLYFFLQWIVPGGIFSTKP